MGWLVTQAFVLYGWMLFRAGSLDAVLQFTGALADWSLPRWWRPYLGDLLMLACPLMVMQVWQWRSGRLNVVLELPRWSRAAVQGVLLLFISAFWKQEASPFIYFQF